MPYKPREIEEMLLGKLEMSFTDADHKWFEFHVDGIPTIKTKLPNHKKDIGGTLESRIYKQLRVRKKFFHELMDCTKNRSEYEMKIKSDPYPPFDHLLV